jgi:chaperonin GroEL
VLTVGKKPGILDDRIKEVKKLLKNEKNPFLKSKIEQRLAMLSGSVGVIRVGANSKIELKEKKDRVEDAIYATKAALKEGIVPGGGIALLNAANSIKTENIGEKILAKAIKSPFTTIMANAGIENYEAPDLKGVGFNVITGNEVDMIKSGIVDPVLVTKTALKNAVSVVNTIISADCVISNVRIDRESS